MSAHSAAPRLAPGTAAGSHRDTLAGARSIADCALPVSIIQRLAAEDILTVSDWLALTPRQRRSIWGVTIAHVRLLDQLAAGMLR